MPIPHYYGEDNTRKTLLSEMATDLATELLLDSDEPYYYGSPMLVANWPCIVGIPGTFMLSEGLKPEIGDGVSEIQLVYVFQEKDPAHSNYEDPAVTCETALGRMFDWLIYRQITRNFPKDSEGNDLFHLYQMPIILRVENEFDSELRYNREGLRLRAGLLSFSVLKRKYFALVTE